MAKVVMALTNDCVSDPRVEKEARALGAAGHDVTILAWDRSGEHALTEERDGFRVERLGPRAQYGGGVRSLPLFRAFWANAVRRALAVAPDVVHCHDLDTAQVGLDVLRVAPDTRLVLDHHEIYRHTRMVPQRGVVGSAARWFVDTLDRRSARAASLVVVANPGNEPHYRRLAEGKVVVVENAPDAQRFHPRTEPRPERPFTLGYVGQKRYVESLAMLVRIVERNRSLAALLAGGGVAEDAVARMAEQAQRVRAIGRLRYDEIPAYYEDVDAVWGVYDAAVGNIKTAFPVKVMEGMACALPVLVDAGTWIGDYVMREGIGVAVDGRDEAAVERTLLQLAEDAERAAQMGAKGRTLVEAGLNWEAASRRLVDAYARMLARERPEAIA